VDRGRIGRRIRAQCGRTGVEWGGIAAERFTFQIFFLFGKRPRRVTDAVRGCPAGPSTQFTHPSAPSTTARGTDAHGKCVGFRLWRHFYKAGRIAIGQLAKFSRVFPRGTRAAPPADDLVRRPQGELAARRAAAHTHRSCAISPWTASCVCNRPIHAVLGTPPTTEGTRPVTSTRWPTSPEPQEWRPTCVAYVRHLTILALKYGASGSPANPQCAPRPLLDVFLRG